MRLRARLLKKIDRSGKLEGFLRDEINTVIADTAIGIENGVKGNGPTPAPYRTGNLRSSCHFELNPAALSAEIGMDFNIAPYAGYVEFSHPYLRPTGMGFKPFFKNELVAAMNRAANKL